jgi:uncharacterized protein YciI
LDRYSLVLLTRPAETRPFPDSEVERLHALHLQHLQTMRERGVMLTAGPFEGQADETLRGMCLYLVGPDEARALAESDPAVAAGRFQVTVFEWLTPPGELSR